MSRADGPICSRCGAEVLWVKREGGASWNPPLTPLGKVYTLNDKSEAIIVDTYTRHRCHPDDLERYQAYLARREQGRADAAAEARDERERARLAAAVNAERAAEWKRERTTMQQTAWRSAKRVQCPKCDQPSRQKCLNLNTVQGRQGRGAGNKHTTWPHPERTLLAEKENP